MIQFWKIKLVRTPFIARNNWWSSHPCTISTSQGRWNDENIWQAKNLCTTPSGQKCLNFGIWRVISSACLFHSTSKLKSVLSNSSKKLSWDLAKKKWTYLTLRFKYLSVASVKSFVYPWCIENTNYVILMVSFRSDLAHVAANRPLC